MANATSNASAKALIFRQRENVTSQKNGKTPWKVLVIDDDPKIHTMTKNILEEIQFEGRKVSLIDGYSGADAQRLLQEHPDLSVLFLDVGMEPPHAGLETVGFIRNTLHNPALRIVLHTGQATRFPEEKIYEEYDINDFLEKSDLPANRLISTLKTSLRAYREFKTFENAQQKEIVSRKSAEAANQAKSTFIADVSHELRSPMHSLLGFIRRLEKTIPTAGIHPALQEELLEYVHYATASSNRLLELVNDLLDTAKLEAGRMDFDMKPVDIWNIFKKLERELLPQLTVKSLTLEIQPPKTGTTIQCDPKKTFQVMINLIGNAIKFSPCQSRVTVSFTDAILVNSTRRAGDKTIPALRIAVHDQGAGIPQEDLKRIFNRFSQSQQHKGKNNGTGLGLEITKRIVTAHRGTILAENNLDGPGSTFTITLPKQQSQAQNN